MFAPILRIIDNVVDGDFYLQAIAVDKDSVGQGSGKILMDKIETRAVESGSARIVLDVSAKNEDARRLYEHCGWTVESQRPKYIKIPSLKFLLGRIHLYNANIKTTR